MQTDLDVNVDSAEKAALRPISGPFFGARGRACEPFLGRVNTEWARQLYDGAGAAHAFDHVLRVLRLAERIAKEEGADLAVVRMATLLHDVARDEPEHHLRGAARARELLAEHPPAFVEAVAHAIEAHRFRAGPAPTTLEAQCLHDADKLDAIGAIGVGRAFAYAGRQGERLWTTPVDQIDFASPPPPTLDYTPGHEFVYKLAQLKEKLYTNAARRIAAERHEFMAAFFRRLDAEAQGMA